MGLAVALILGAPLVMYSLAPPGPLRNGDTVFSDGEQRVRLAITATNMHQQPGEICLLDPNSPLILVDVPNSEPDGSLLAQVQGTPAAEWPFCPLHAEVLLKTHQLFQKPALLREGQRMLARLWDR
jgi:hypothetical protein